MASRNTSRTTGNKRLRGEAPASSSQNPQPIQPEPQPANQPFDQNRFPTFAHSKRFIQMKKYKPWTEKFFDIHPDGEQQEFLHMFTDRRWNRLIRPETKFHIDLVKEFWCNATPVGSETTLAESFSYTTYVRGKIIRFDRDAINDFLGKPLELEESPEPTVPTLCAYGIRRKRGNWSFQQIERDILIKGRRFVRNATGEIRHALYNDMNAKAGVVFNLLIRNVMPKSHTSDAPKSMLPLIWCIMNKVDVDIARQISNEMKCVALNIATGSKGALTFPGLIMGLLRAEGVPIPRTNEEIKHPINDKFIRKLLKRKQKAAMHYFSDDEGGPSDVPFDMSVFQSFMQEQQQHNEYVRSQNSHIMDQNEAIYRSNQGIQQDLYNAHMHQGNAEYPLMTPAQYQTFVHWPEGRPEAYVGAAAAEDDEATDDDDILGHGDDLEIVEDSLSDNV